MKNFAKPQVGHGLFTLSAGTSLPALVSAFKLGLYKTQMKTKKCLLEMHESEKEMDSDSERKYNS